jgi:hypothetical protein
MAAARKSVAALRLFEVSYLCGGERGSRQVWAPDAAGASQFVRDRASLLGLRFSTVLVTRVLELEIREEELRAA